ncbi:reverse transcriptase domain-containing protein [Tanacetum coccineum]
MYEEGYCWMTPLIEYLAEGTLPAEIKKARAIKIKARQYALGSGVLYRKSFLEPWLWCVGPVQADYVVKEIHEGSCSMHSGPRSVVVKAIRYGYYWPTMHQDARNIIRKCDDCQTHRPVSKNLQQKLTTITSLWPFYKWGIDISGPFLEAQRKVKFLIIAIVYFTKWIEPKPVATITRNQVKKFVWDNIMISVDDGHSNLCIRALFILEDGASVARIWGVKGCTIIAIIYDLGVTEGENISDPKHAVTKPTRVVSTPLIIILVATVDTAVDTVVAEVGTADNTGHTVVEHT